MELNYKVQLIGAKPPRDYFWIRIPTENYQSETENGTLYKTIVNATNTEMFGTFHH